jgi:hypothetical protein
MLERVRARVGRREVGNEAKWDLGGVRDLVACFARDEEGVEGCKACLVDMVGLQPKLGQGLGFGKEVERQNGGGKNVGSPLQGCRYRRMM